MAKTVISIEIGTAKVRMAELVLGKTRQTIKKADIFDTPDGAIEDGYIRDSSVLSEQISLRLKNLKVTTKNIVFSIASAKVVSREVIVSAEKEKLLKTIIASEVDNYFPMDLTGYVVAHAVIGRDLEQKQYRVMVYAAPEALLQQYYELAEDMRCEVLAIDFAGNSLYQWLKRSAIEDVSLVIEVNNSSSILTILNHGDMGVQRTVAYGTGVLANALIETRAYDEATSQNEALKLLQAQNFFAQGESENNLWKQSEIVRIRARRFERIENSKKAALNNDEAAATSDTPVNPDADTENNPEANERSVERLLSDDEILNRRINARGDVADAAKQLTANIRRVLDYYTTKNPESAVQKIYITGQGATIIGLERFIAADMGIPTEIFNVTEGITFIKDAMQVEEMGSDFLGCFGAAVNPLGLRSADAILRERKKNIAILSGAIFVAAVLGLGYLVVLTKIQIGNEEKRQVKLEADIKDIESIEHLQQVFQASQTSIAAMAVTDELIYTMPEQLNDIIAALEKAVPRRTIVTSFDMNANRMVINFTTVTKEEAALLLRNLKEIPYVELTNVAGIVENVDEVTKKREVAFTVDLTIKRYIAPKTQEGTVE